VEDRVAYTEAFEDAYDAGADAVVGRLRVRHGPEALREPPETRREEAQQEESRGETEG
jgi:hypothetical protein